MHIQKLNAQQLENVLSALYDEDVKIKGVEPVDGRNFESGVYAHIEVSETKKVLYMDDFDCYERESRTALDSGKYHKYVGNELKNLDDENAYTEYENDLNEQETY